MSFDTTPFWSDVPSKPEFPAIEEDHSADAIVIGGGIAGVTTAYLLAQAGVRVVLLERDSCGQGDTGRTTSHLTAVTDTRFTDLVPRFGVDHASAVWDAGFAALAEIEATVEREHIDCEFEWCPGYLCGVRDPTSKDQWVVLADEARSASDAGFDATFVDAVPELGVPGVRFDHQAKFHPLKYLYALLAALPVERCRVFEHSNVDEIAGGEDGAPVTVRARGHAVRAPRVVIATHVPLAGKTPIVRATLLQSDLFSYSTYAVRAELGARAWPRALFWDMSEPYWYVRVDGEPPRPSIVIGGADHKTGQTDDPRRHFEQVIGKLHEIAPDARVTHQWSGQVVDTRDRLPYLGENAPGQFVMTGFSGNGFTFGTLGALMARDWVTHRVNPWYRLFDVNRTGIARGAWNYLKENKDYPYYLVRDRFAGAKGRSLRAVNRGEGQILEIDGRPSAVSRDMQGRVTILSPTCTHLGCTVRWNMAERTWDCPCHGSRFAADGAVIAGPAETPLRPLENT